MECSTRNVWQNSLVLRPSSAMAHGRDEISNVRPNGRVLRPGLSTARGNGEERTKFLPQHFVLEYAFRLRGGYVEIMAGRESLAKSVSRHSPLALQ